MKTRKGFTLIELLVVVSIIGLILSIALASLRSAKDKAADANIKANLGTVKTQTALYFDTHGDLGFSPADPCQFEEGTLFGDPTIIGAIESAKTASGGFASCYSNADKWAVAVQMRESPTTAWCIDWRGTTRQYPIGSAVDQEAVDNLIVSDHCGN